MDHSLYAYLERQPLLKLETLLQELRAGTDEATCAYVVPMIEEILQKRKNKDIS